MGGPKQKGVVTYCKPHSRQEFQKLQLNALRCFPFPPLRLGSPFTTPKLLSYYAPWFLTLATRQFNIAALVPLMTTQSHVYLVRPISLHLSSPSSRNVVPARAHSRLPLPTTRAQGYPPRLHLQRLLPRHEAGAVHVDSVRYRCVSIGLGSE